MMNFSDIASKKIEDVERPPLAPVGTYHWQITKLPVITASKDGLWEFVSFPAKVVEPMEDVDAEEYKGDLTAVVSEVKFVFNKSDEAAFGQTEYRLRTFLEKHLNVADKGMSIREALNASVGAHFLAAYNHRANKDNPEETFGQIGKTAPLD